MYADETGKIKSSDYSGGRTAKEMVTFVADKAKVGIADPGPQAATAVQHVAARV